MERKSNKVSWGEEKIYITREGEREKEGVF
jgi:hypothetical protein